VPRLTTIPFAKRILTKSDVERLLASASTTPSTASADDDVSKEDQNLINNSCCAICIDDYQEGDSVRDLPCGHIFHDSCVDEWLLKHNRLCPVCKQDVLKVQKKSSEGAAQKNKRSDEQEHDEEAGGCCSDNEEGTVIVSSSGNSSTWRDWMHFQSIRFRQWYHEWRQRHVTASTQSSSHQPLP
jgi:hypothetical protein